MTATLICVELVDAVDAEDAVAKIQATVDVICAHSAFTREQFVLAGDDEEGGAAAWPITDVTLADALATGAPVDLHVVIDAPEDVVLPLIAQCDPCSDEPRLDIAADDAGLDARGLLLSLVELWPCRLGFVADEALIDAVGDFVVPVGQYTWLDEDLHWALAVSDVPAEEQVAGGWLYTLPHGIGDPAAVDDAIAIVDGDEELDLDGAGPDGAEAGGEDDGLGDDGEAESDD